MDDESGESMEPMEEVPVCVQCSTPTCQSTSSGTTRPWPFPSSGIWASHDALVDARRQHEVDCVQLQFTNSSVQLSSSAVNTSLV